MSAPEWPPPVQNAGPSTRRPWTTAGKCILHSPGELAEVDRCAGPCREVPCVRVERGGIVCPRCETITAVGEHRIGPRLPECSCYPALCAHWPLAGVRTR